MSTRAQSHSAAGLWMLAAALGVAPAAAAEAPAQDLAAGAPVRWQAPATGSRTWAVPLAADEHATVEVSTGVLVIVTLRDPSGETPLQRLLVPEDASEPASVSLSWVSDGEGRWELEVATDGEVGGEVEVHWSSHGNATPAQKLRWRFDRIDFQVDLLLFEDEPALAWERARAAIEARREMTADEDETIAEYLDDLGARFYYAQREDAYASAEKLYQEALQLREQRLGPDHLDLADNLSNLATVQDPLGKWTEAEENERRALAIRKAHLTEEDPRLGEGHRDYGLVLYNLGRLSEALVHLERSRDLLASAAPKNPLRVDLLIELGDVTRALDDYDTAETLLQQALALAGELGVEDDELLGRLFNILAGIYKDQHRLAEAERMLVRSREHREAVGDPGDLATIRLNFAELYRLQGRETEADPLYQEALELAREIHGDDNPELVVFLNQQAVLRAQQGRTHEAEKLYRKSIRILDTAFATGHLVTAQGLSDLAGLLQDAGRHGDADPFLRRALAIREDLLGDSHPEVALITNQLAAGLLARSRRKRSPATAELLDRSLSILGSTSAYPEARAEALVLRARLLRPGSPDAAGEELGRALALIGSLRPRAGGGELTRATFLRKHLDTYDLRVAWHLEDGEIDEALAASERARGRAFLDQLTAAQVDLRDGIPVGRRGPLEEREAAVRRRIAELQDRIRVTRERAGLPAVQRLRQLAELGADLEAATGEYQRNYEEIRNESPAWRALDPDGSLGAREIQQRLVPENGTMLVYHVGREGSHLFVVPPPGAPVRALPLVVTSRDAKHLGVAAGPVHSGTLEEIVLGRTRLLARLGEAPPGSASVRDLLTILESLARVLLPPAALSAIVDGGEVLVVPDGTLHLIPFEALVLETPAGREHWLDAGRPVRYAPSAAALHHLLQRDRARTRAASGPALLSVTDPVYDLSGTETDDARGQTRTPGLKGPLPRLPGTKRETEAIREHIGKVPGASIRVLERLQATERNVRDAIEDADHLHLATHGLVNTRDRELFAALALAPPRQTGGDTADDGYLHLFEIYELDLDAELAVLSACDSHRGRYVEGEGVFALSRGFLTAGARRVVASQWQVSDDSTAVLMGAFFEAIAAQLIEGEPVNYAAALQSAKRRVREDGWAAPFYWAPFVLVGVP